MTQENVAGVISDNLERARILIEEALTLGRQHDIPVDLGRTGVANNDDVWYTDPKDYLDDIKGDYGEDSEEYAEALERVKEGDPYDSWGHKQWGWMSSSTNC